jgi:DMSO reductase anchor subunit
VIVFTVCAGAGYGLLILTAVAAPLGLFGSRADLVAPAAGLALAAIVTGLLSSTLHLGRRARAWRAITQWRSSWLAREGVAALAGLPPAALFAGLSWLGFWPTLATVTGLVAATLALITIFCTAMIYASLIPIARWRSRWTPAVYFAFAFLSGALLLASLAGKHATGLAAFDWVAAAAIFAGWALKSFYWRDQPNEGFARATGLEALGRTRVLWAQDGASTFVHREMLRSLSPERARKLRLIVHVVLFGLPLALIAFALLGPPSANAPASWAATISATVGLCVERWLFFAEARHASRVFYL